MNALPLFFHRHSYWLVWNIILPLFVFFLMIPVFVNVKKRNLVFINIFIETLIIKRFIISHFFSLLNNVFSFIVLIFLSCFGKLVFTPMKANHDWNKFQEWKYNYGRKVSYVFNGTMEKGKYMCDILTAVLFTKNCTGFHDEQPQNSNGNE